MANEAETTQEVYIRWDGQSAQTLFELLSGYLPADQVTLSVGETPMFAELLWIPQS